MNLPTISIIIPTLNSSKTLGLCIDSIISQDYPKDKIEFVFADGGSTDGTIDLIKQKLSTFRYSLYANPLKTGEAGKAVGVKNARNEIIALIDSDNILPQQDWLTRMVKPFFDNEIIAAEPVGYTYRKEDSYITRYCALIGMNDPICFFVGNYDRFSLLSNKWTEVPIIEEDKGGYLKIEFSDIKNIPTIGANGFLIRKDIIQQYEIGDYLFDIDIIFDLISKNKFKIAKVKTGIIHLYCDEISQFVRKQRRRIRDFNYYNKLGLRKYPWGSIKKGKIIKFSVYTVLIAPVLFQSIKGFLRKRDFSWFFHPLACILTLFVYGYNTIRNILNKSSIESRQFWKQ
jgi:glycosyltransferase involved in cell wall biosynthesis